MRRLAPEGPPAGISVGDLLRAFEELEQALAELVGEDESALGSAQWRRTQALLRQAERVLVMELVLDLERRRELEEGSLSALLEALPAAVWLVDGEQRIRYANGRVFDLFRVQARALVGRSLAEALDAVDLSLFADPGEMRSCIEAGAGQPANERELELRDGRTLLCRSLPVAGAAFAGRALVLDDITAARAGARALDETALVQEVEELRRRSQRVLEGVRRLHASIERQLRAVPIAPTVEGVVPAGARALRRSLHGGPTAITRREREVLALLSQGQKNDEIAAELGLASETVRTYVQRALEKLGAETRTQAVALALKHGLIH
jgi:DNA-binding CsgD family transcriptional regulator